MTHHELFNYPDAPKTPNINKNPLTAPPRRLLMLCYKDRTFCDSDCINTDCCRNFTPDDRNKVIALNLPVSWADYSKDCPDYTPPTAEKEKDKC